MGTACSSIVMPTPEAPAISLSADARPPARRVAQDMRIRRGAEHGRRELVERLRVRSDLHFEPESLPDAHDRHAVQADRAREDDGVAGSRVVGGKIDALRQHADPRGVDEDAVRRSPPDDLRVAGDDRDAGGVRGMGGGLRDAAQLVEGEPLLDDVRERQRDRPGAHHREVVDRAVDRELADIATGEFERRDDEGVRRKGQPLATDGEHGGVVQRPAGRRYAECRRDEVAHERRRQLATGAVTEHDALGLRRGRGTIERQRVDRGAVGFGVGHRGHRATSGAFGASALGAGAEG